MLFPDDDDVSVKMSAIFSNYVLLLYGTPFSYWWLLMLAMTILLCCCGALHASVFFMATFSSICPLSVMATVPPMTMQLERQQQQQQQQQRRRRSD